MRLLFAHDHFFELDPTGRFFSDKFSYALWERYLQHFSSIVVVARKRTVQNSTRSIAYGEGVTLQPVPTLSSVRGLLRTPQKVLKLISACISEVDAVVVRLPSEIGLHTFTLAQQMNKPILVELVGCPWDSLWNYGSVKGKLYAPLAFLRNHHTVGGATHVMYVTQTYLQQRYPTRGRAIGVSDVQIPFTPAKVLSRRLAKPLPRDHTFRIGLTGSLLHYKGIETLLEAGVVLKERSHQIRLLFLGDGNQEPWQVHAERLGIGAICEFVGTLPTGNRVFEWLDSLDLYVQPSLVEGLPRATLEAMSRACPVVASKVGGIPELLPSDNLFPPGDSRTLADRIERMILNQAWRTEASRANFQKAFEYTQDILERKRNSFLAEFASFARSGSHGQST